MFGQPTASSVEDEDVVANTDLSGNGAGVSLVITHYSKKSELKSTYPPPADGLCVPFLCKGQSGAITGSAQACCGGCGRCTDCTQCKVL